MSIAVESSAVAPPVAEATSDNGHRHSTRRRSHVYDAFWIIGISVASVVIAMLVYRVWDANLHLPLGHSFDMRGLTASIKGLGQHGWWDRNSNLGAPFVQDMRDFPSSGETSQMVVLRIIVAVTHSPALTVNIYFFAGFAVLAAVAFLVFRRLGLSAPVAAALALAYDFLPYHLFHGPDHLTRSTYLTAPLAVLLLVRVLEPSPRFLRDPSRPVRRPWFGAQGSVRVRPLLALLAVAVVIGCTETMTTTFTVVLLVILGLVAALATRRVSRLAFALIVAGAIIGTFVVVNIPVLLHVRAVGRNPIAGVRFAYESDMYGLRPSLMLLPTPVHWVYALGSAARTLLRGNPQPSEGGQAIGTIGVIGVLTALAMLMVRALRSDSGRDSHRRPISPIAAPLASIVVVAIILGAGGATSLDVVSGFVQVRTWDRIVVIIAFAAFALVGLGLERFHARNQQRIRSPRVRNVVTIAMVLVIAGLGVLDGGQPQRVNDKVVTAEWTSDRAFVAAMHTVQPPNGMIFEFPVVRFPESGPLVRMNDYDQLRGYVADTGSFRWSYGAVKGRPEADWQLKLPKFPTETDLQGLIGMGFTGLWVNRDGYTDGGQAFEAALVPLLGRPTLVSPNHRLSFYDLRPFASRIPAGTDLVAVARARFGITPPKSN